MKKILIPAVVMSTMVLLRGLAPAAELSITLEPAEYRMEKDADGYDRIMMRGYTNAGAPGDPQLPSKVFQLLVPPEIDWETLALSIEDRVVELLPHGYDLRAEGPDTAGRDGELIQDWGPGARKLSGGRNLDVYGQDAFFPEAPVELLPYSQMRKWKFARVNFHPFQYNAFTGELRLTRSVRITVRYELGSQASWEEGTPEDTVMDTLVSGLARNYVSGKAAYTRAGSAREAAARTGNYVIVTSNATVAGSTVLSSFVAHKQARGHTVRVVTESDFGSLRGQAPDRRAEKIRQWLINHYLSLGIEYVLLIGDPTPYEKGEGDIPMKMCWPRRGAGSDEESPTDAFYADLTGNWDANGNGYYGEWSDYTASGGVDFSVEVWVGRIPVYNGDVKGLDAILQKTMDYETAGPAAWKRNVLLPMSFSTPDYDGAPLAEQMKNDYLYARNFDAWTQYQQGYGSCGLKSAYPSDEELRGGSVVRDRWATTPFGIVAWWGHGSVTAASVGAEGCWDGTLFSMIQNTSLRNDKPAFTFQCSCTNGYPENARNLQFALLQRGGVATVSASRVSWFNAGTGYGQFDGSSTNSGIGYEYVDRLTRSMPAGRALYEAKLAVVGDVGARNTRLMNQFDFNLYGDPSLKIGACPVGGNCDEEIDPETPSWGTPASVLGGEYSRPSSPANTLAMFVLPVLAVWVLRVRRLGGMARR